LLSVRAYAGEAANGCRALRIVSHEIRNSLQKMEIEEPDSGETILENGISCWSSTEDSSAAVRADYRERNAAFPLLRPDLLNGVRAGRAASRPRMAGTVNTPVLDDLAFAIDVDCAGIAMHAGYLPSMHLLPRFGRPDGLFDSSVAIIGMHGCVAVAVGDNGRDRLSVRNSLVAGSAALTHRRERGGHVGRGPVGQAGEIPTAAYRSL
jgi:hypothetical protein